jgi:hypothetical protein
MLNKGSYREAIGMILAFELQDAFPLADILNYMVEKVVHSRKDQGTEGQSNLAGSVCSPFSHAIWRGRYAEMEFNCCVWFSGFNDCPGKFFPL